MKETNESKQELILKKPIEIGVCGTCIYWKDSICLLHNKKCYYDDRCDKYIDKNEGDK
jgi:hypothetical protein